ncbi:KEOPS complex subunit Cgi121 [Halomicrococcus gelatinilyticus]|uniref:KEOPS complex subunit Cgi121 n=1 Tax=Halomicrococcus gelatinilyticus TaxID=1702103 RepID=UPI002E0D44D1
MRLVEGVASVDDVDAFLTRLGDAAATDDCAVQAFDARYVTGRAHLEAAVEHASRAFERGENVARDRAVEILLYAAGRRQIDQALAMGVGEGEQPVVVVVDCGGGDGDVEGAEAMANDAAATAVEDAEAATADVVADLLTPAETLDSDVTDRELVREFFGVTEAELAATDADLADLVRERVALLDVEK